MYITIIDVNKLFIEFGVIYFILIRKMLEDIKRERLKSAIEYLKSSGYFENNAQIAEKLGYKRSQTISDFVVGRAPINDKFIKTFSLTFGFEEAWLKGEKENFIPPVDLRSFSMEDMQAFEKAVRYEQSIGGGLGATQNTGYKTGAEISNQKAFGVDEDPGLIYVPVAAQAGYAKHLTEPIFLGQLKRWRIPDFPYKGDKFRIFQVEGDSMCYTSKITGAITGLLDGMEVVAQRVEFEDWEHSTQWYIHVVVFEDYLVIKRLYREKGNKTFVLISDNPLYAQRRINIEDIKELWIMKRYLGWNVPPPQEFEINI